MHTHMYLPLMIFWDTLQRNIITTSRSQNHTVSLVIAEVITVQHVPDL